MTGKELRIKRRKRIRRRRIFIWCLKRVVLCAACVIIVSCFFKRIGTRSGQIRAQEFGNIDYNENYEYNDISFEDGYENGEKIDWNLTLVNQTHPINEEYTADITLTKLKNGQSIDSRCYPYLQKMMDDCREEGYNPIICSSFRTYQKQEELFNEQIRVYLNQGMSYKDAETEAAKSVAIPGTSEHELGLAVDITDIDSQKIVSGMEAQPVQRWLMENSWRYGFILRYPLDKSDVTGIVYEPWHYRYVGYEAAKYIYENQITLEEYINMEEYTNIVQNGEGMLK